MGPKLAPPCHPDTWALQVISGHGAFWKLPFPRAEKWGQWPSPVHVSKAPSGRQAALGPTPSRRFLPPGRGQLRPPSLCGWGTPQVTCSRRACPRRQRRAVHAVLEEEPARQPVDGSSGSTTGGKPAETVRVLFLTLVPRLLLI